MVEKQLYKQRTPAERKAHAEMLLAEKMTFERKIELIGPICIYHPTMNPKGYKITGLKGGTPL